MTALHKTKWFLPLFSVALGLLFLGALWAGGERRAGIESLAVMSGVSLVLLLGGRSDLIRGLRGDGRDEYWQRIDVHATALAGNVAILGMCAWEWAHGDDGSPYVQLGAIAGVAYVAATRLPQVEELSSVSTVGSSARRGGLTSRHVH